MIRGTVLALLVAVGGASAAVVPPLDSYRHAEARRELGVVSGRVYAERARPTTGDVPFPGVTVTLVPYSEDVVAAVEDVKTNARGSMRSYQRAASVVREIREAYERALSKAGAGDLVRSEVTSADGTFVIANVPSGRWLVLARRETWQERSWRRPTVREREVFLPIPEVAGLRAISLWLVPVTVSPGSAVVLELSDRAVWFTGIEEEERRGTVR